MIVVTPTLPFPPWVSVGHGTVDPAPRRHTDGTAAATYLVKFSFVPDESERWATVIAVLGNVTPGFSAAIAGSFHFVMSRWKIFAISSGVSLSVPFKLGRLYETVIGAATVGMYDQLPPLILARSVLGNSPSEVPKSVTWSAKS